MKKKILALLLAMAMTMGMSTVAFAAPSDTATVIINNKAGSQNEHTYVMYQILKGEVSTEIVDNNEVSKISDATWGSAVASAVTVAGTTYANDKTGAKSFVTMLADPNTNPVAVATELGALSLTAYNTAAQTSSGTVSFTDVPEGYYLIKDTAVVADTNGAVLDTVSKYMMVLVGSDMNSESGVIQVTSKNETTTSTKHVKDKNDSQSADFEKVGTKIWYDSADYDLNDYIPFRFEATVADDPDSYKEVTVPYIFHDAMSSGLTLIKDDKDHPMVVSVLDKDGNAKSITVGYVLDDTAATFAKTASSNNDKKTIFSITVETKGVGIDAGDTIVFEYWAQLNSSAKVGPTGNPNDMYLEVANDPYGDGRGTTPVDTSIIFSYGVTVNKVDSQQKPLEGAEFTLYKKVVDGTADVEIDESTYKVVDGGTNYNYKQIAVITPILNDDETAATATYNHIDDGTYLLIETKTPVGYNTADPVPFIISATHGQDPDELTITGFNVNNDKFNANVETGIVATEIINSEGNLLPSTGGIGTTLFYVIGGILVVGGGAMLFVKRKMGREEM